MASPSRRRLTVSRVSRASSGVYFYHVDVVVYSSSSSHSDCDPPLVYSVLRRYSDFQELFERLQIALYRRSAYAAFGHSPPAFPDKELLSPSLFGSLMWLPTAKSVLEDRRRKFQRLLQWTERHPVARETPAYEEFLGQPPQVQDGYTSLKEYAAPDWLADVQQAASRSKEQRKRRRAYTMDGPSTVDRRRGSLGGGSVKSEPTRSIGHNRPEERHAGIADIFRQQEEEEDERRVLKGIVKPPILISTPSAASTTSTTSTDHVEEPESEEDAVARLESTVQLPPIAA